MKYHYTLKSKNNTLYVTKVKPTDPTKTWLGGYLPITSSSLKNLFEKYKMYIDDYDLQMVVLSEAEKFDMTIDIMKKEINRLYSELLEKYPEKFI